MNPNDRSTVNFRPLIRKPALIYDKLTITLPSPDHMKHAIALGSLHNEDFEIRETKGTFYAPTEFLKMTAKEIRTPIRCRG
jgi:hypothetical protein